VWPKSGVSGKKNLTHFTRTSGTPAEDCAWLAVEEIEPVDLADEDEDEDDDEVVDGGKRPPRRPPPSVEVVAAV
jgi:hypothetical protein